MSRYSDYLAGGRWTWRAELFSRAGELLATNNRDQAGDAFVWEVDPGAVSLGGSQISQRTASFTVPVTDRILIPSPGGLLHPDSGNKVRFSTGLVNATRTVLWPLATMLVDEATLAGGSGLALTVGLVDALSPLRAETDETFVITDGELVSAVLTRLLLLVLNADEFVVADTGEFTCPPAMLAPATSIIGTISELLEGVGHELVADANGLVVTREVLPTDDNQTVERWYYGPGGIPIQEPRRIWRSRVPQGWKIEGGSFLAGSQTASVIVVDTDPESEGYWRPDARARVIRSTRSSWIRSTRQAITAGYAKLRATGVGAGEIEFVTLPNGALQEGDLIALSLDEANATGTYRVTGFTMPVRAQAMRIRARKVYDPERNFDLPVDPSEGGIAAFNDTFNRPDQNLENLPGSPGADNWTEVGWSWGVVGNQAIQRYDRGWSLAYPNTALFFSDHRATIAVVKIPAGRRLGPVIRYSGSGKIDGYAALADSSGNVSLESWWAGNSVAVLGTVSVGAVEGKDLSVEASGSTLVVRVGTDAVLTVTDSTRQGNFAGMLAYGGPTGNAPAVDEFTIEETT